MAAGRPPPDRYFTKAAVRHRSTCGRGRRLAGRVTDRCVFAPPELYAAASVLMKHDYSRQPHDPCSCDALATKGYLRGCRGQCRVALNWCRNRHSRRFRERQSRRGLRHRRGCRRCRRCRGSPVRVECSCSRDLPGLLCLLCWTRSLVVGQVRRCGVDGWLCLRRPWRRRLVGGGGPYRTWRRPGGSNRWRRGGGAGWNRVRS